MSSLFCEHTLRFDIGWASFDETKSMIEVDGRDTKRHVENNRGMAKFVQALHGFDRQQLTQADMAEQGGDDHMPDARHTPLYMYQDRTGQVKAIEGMFGDKAAFGQKWAKAPVLNGAHLGTPAPYIWMQLIRSASVSALE